jgi:hypothetical protein
LKFIFIFARKVKEKDEFKSIFISADAKGLLIASSPFYKESVMMRTTDEQTSANINDASVMEKRMDILII